MERVYNFAPGPAMLPQQALETAAAEMLSYQGTGMSVMEMSHRSKGYQAIFDESVALLKDLMHIPDNYTVLLLHGGATGQFAAVPLNLLKTTADYADTGTKPTATSAARRPPGRTTTPISQRSRRIW